MDALKMHTPDLAAENFRKLAALFPNAVTETKDETGKLVRAIDADVLRQEIAAYVVEGREERYQFTWPDKRKAILTANAPISKTLRPCREESVGRDGTPGGFDSENLYIEGDNLEVLKLLRETYLGKIKMIYIDPPYNTGTDFIYKDNFAESTDEYLEHSGQYDDSGNRLVPNLESNGRFHTDWLNTMYPRLKLARDLLADDGVIFISIDDNELENLKKICDEVFGEKSFLATFVWKRRASSALDRSKCSTDHEYVLAYKMRDFLALRGVDKDYKGYANPDNDPRGPWTAGDLTVGMTADMRPNQYYDLIDPKTGKIYKPSYNRVWSYIPESMEVLIADDRIVFPEDTSKRPMKKRFASELDSNTNPQSTWMDNIGMNTEATHQMYELFGKSFFAYTKPESLIKTLILQATDENSIILDFFSGSATTAHAVIAQNFHDVFEGRPGKRKFILVQLPEPCKEGTEAYKAGYKNICEIGKERIRRAGKHEYMDVRGIAGSGLRWNDEQKEKLGEQYVCPDDVDIGFRVLKLDSSNMEDVYYTPDKVVQTQPGPSEGDIGEQLVLDDGTEKPAQISLDSLVNNIKADRTPEDLLFQVMLDIGVPLSSSIMTMEIAGHKVFDVGKNFLLACFDRNITEETITEIAKRCPSFFVMRDSSIASDVVAANFEQIFRTYSPETERRVL